MTEQQTPASLRAQASELSRKAKALKRAKDKRLTTFSHVVMAGIMSMFFVGVALGVYSTLFCGEPVSTTLDYIMQLAYVVSLGYFIKAFGENIAKIVLSGIFKARSSESGGDDYEGGV